MPVKVELLADATTKRPAAKRNVRPRPPHADARTRKLSTLTADVQRLTLHIARLQELRALLMERTMSRADSVRGSLAKTIELYFDVFRRGYQPSVHVASTNSLVQTNSFIASVMDEEVLGGGFRGVETLIELWKRFNAVFNNMELRLTEIAFVPPDGTEDNDNLAFATATATVTHSGYITLQTIQILFPHVMSNAALVMSILGRPVSGSGRTNFVYDCATSKVLSCMIDIDMVGTFAAVVENPRDLDILFKRAMISSEGFIGERDCIPANRAIAPAETKLVGSPVCAQDAMDMKTLLSSEDELYPDDEYEGTTSIEMHIVDSYA